MKRIDVRHIPWEIGGGEKEEIIRTSGLQNRDNDFGLFIGGEFLDIMVDREGGSSGENEC